MSDYADQTSSCHRLASVQLEARNVALAMRVSLRYLIQTLTEENVITHLKPEPSDASFATVNSVLERLMLTAFEILIDMPVANRSYALEVEATSILLILLSVQMYSVRPAQKSLIYRTIMSKKFSIHALLLMKVLLSNFAKQEVPPVEHQSGSIIIGLASGLWNVLSLGYGKSEDMDADPVLARLSLLLILVLTNHCTADSNAYRDAMFCCVDVKAGSEEPVTGFRIDFQSVFNAFCEVESDDQTTLLLYILLHKNMSFRNYVISRATDLDLIIVPILQILYDCPERSSHHVYMALIILLILSEDTLFNEAVHDNVCLPAFILIISSLNNHCQFVSDRETSALVQRKGSGRCVTGLLVDPGHYQGHPVQHISYSGQLHLLLLFHAKVLSD